MVLADVSPLLAAAALLGGLGVPAALAWPGALVAVVSVAAKARSSARGLALWVQPTLLSPPEGLAALVVLASHWEALAPVVQRLPEKRRAVYAVRRCIALVMVSLEA